MDTSKIEISTINSLVKLSTNYLKDYTYGAFEQRKVLAIFDDNTYSLFFAKIKNSLFKNCRVFNFVIFNGEKDKSLSSAEKCYNIMCENEFTSADFVVSVGGGVVSDLGGFVAGTFNRGIAHVIIPTTLLSIIDASIGGKASLNNVYAKNKIGIYHNPKKILCDIAFLDSLPDKEWKAGYGEIVKYALLSGGKLLDNAILSINDNLAEIITECIEYKMSIVETQNTELRNLLSFGHTVGYAIEKAGNYNIGHGMAVATGLIVELLIDGVINETSVSAIEVATGLVERYGLKADIKGLNIADYIKYDKKIRGSNITVISLKEVGKPKAISVPLDKFTAALNEVLSDFK